MRRSIDFIVSYSGCVALAMGILVLPLKWLLAWLAAAVLHELCHVAAVLFCGGSIRAISLGAAGARLHITDVSPGKECICALAGPFGGLMLLFALRYIPMIAMCAVIQSLANLLPIYPMDGGRVMRCLSQSILPKPSSERLCTWICYTTLAIVWGLCMYGMLCMKLGVAPILLALAMTVRTKFEKSLANNT